MTEISGGRVRFGLWYDFRNPPAWRRPYEQIYAEILDQISWAEEVGFDNVWLSEHHFVEDGYCPSLLPTAAAIAARTRRIRIGTSVMPLPLHNPVRVAEDAATVDILSCGRLELGVGSGYRIEEFDGFAIPKKERGARTDECLEIISRLWAGETLTFKGKYYEVNNLRLAPAPVQRPRPPLWVGGDTLAGLRRAARFGDGYIGVDITKEFFESYVAELMKIGKPTTNLPLAGGKFYLIASNDPERTWHEAADHVIYQVNKYSEWLEKAGLPVLPHIRDRAHLRETGILTVAEPQACIKIIRDSLEEVPLTHFCSWTLPPGMPASWAQPHLELFASRVIPAFR